MHFRKKSIGVGLSAVFCCLLLVSQLGFASAKRRKSMQKPPTAPVQEAPPIPQPPPTPEEMPAAPPRVTMDNGMLSISAENSTLGDILNAVRKQTGASLDIPPSLSAERVAAKLGPGNPRDVLQHLFAGSKFDYIIVGSPQNPGALQQITLTLRGAGGASGPAVASNQPMNRPTQSNYQPPAQANDVTDEEPQPEPEPAPPEPPVTPPTGAQPNSNQPKTPEQLLLELQQMQQQQQRPPRSGGPQAPPQPQ
jgi:hypothetical protein